MQLSGLRLSAGFSQVYETESINKGIVMPGRRLKGMDSPRGGGILLFVNWNGMVRLFHADR